MTENYLVTAEWDNEAGVWVATSDDVPGLVSEAATLDDLVRRVLLVTPELLDDNGVPRKGRGTVEIHIVSELTLAAAE